MTGTNRYSFGQRGRLQALFMGSMFGLTVGILGLVILVSSVDVVRAAVAEQTVGACPPPTVEARRPQLTWERAGHR